MIHSVCITVQEIKEKFEKLDDFKGPGPDGIPPLLVKKCAESLSIPLCVLYNKSLTSGTFPSRWKIAHVVPVFKSGDRSLCVNYRPISILSCFAKILETFVYDVLYHQFKPLLTDKQHGFVKNKSTVSNLLEYKSYLCGVFAGRGQVDTVYTDFSKAFDRVNHSLLCSKLEGYGVHGSLFRWIESYLSRRSQLVALKGDLSTAFVAPSGVPQGSHLGPLFFVLFINGYHALACCMLMT
jgi:hypothetical protein